MLEYKKRVMDKIIMNIIFDAVSLGWTIKKVGNNIYELKKNK